MNNDFSRSLRAIGANNLQVYTLSTVLIIVLMSGWLLWLFFAQIAFYELSSTATINTGQNVRRYTVITTFLTETFKKIDYDQVAFFTPDGSSDDNAGIPIEILKIDTDQEKVTFVVQNSNSDKIPENGTNGVVRVRIKSISPATLILDGAKGKK